LVGQQTAAADGSCGLCNKITIVFIYYIIIISIGFYKNIILIS